MKILNTIKNFNPEAKKILQSVGEVVDCGQTALDLVQRDLIGQIGKYEILIANLNLDISKMVIDAGKNLKIIATPTTGLDHIDVDYAKKKGIEVISLKDEDEFLRTITGTAELAFGLIIALIRKIPWAFADVKKGVWNREQFIGHSLSGKTLGIIGMGRLGSMMANYAKAFGMKVIAYNKGDQESDFDNLLKQSDIISIHAPLNQETEGLIGESELDKMKLGAYLINTARGKIIDEDAFIKALEDKKIAGYATDVLADEINFATAKSSALKLIDYAKDHDNVIITPHLGGMTYESRAATDIFIAEKIKDNYSL